VKVRETGFIDVRFFHCNTCTLLIKATHPNQIMIISPGSHLSGLRLKMTRTGNGKDERMFSIELRSKEDVKSVSLEDNDRVLIEGSVGSFVRAHFLEDLVLEVIGSNGALRVDLAEKDLHPRPQKSEGSIADRGNGQ
jgi:predicted dehydrogenase